MRRILEIADELRAIAGNGLHYSEGLYDRERYERLMELAARLASTVLAEDEHTLEAVYRAADIGYATPKLDVRLAVFRDDRVLLVRERLNGRWALPGGYVDIGDSPSEAALRETAEEAGVEARVRRLVGVYDNRARPDSGHHLFHVHKLVFLGELTDPEAAPRARGETLEAAFCRLDALPELSLSRTLPLHIQHAHLARQDPTLPTHFD